MDMGYQKLWVNNHIFMKDGPIRVGYHTNKKNKITKALQTFQLVGIANTKGKIEETLKGRPFNIVLNRISLPRCLCNDWFSLPRGVKTILKPTGQSKQDRRKKDCEDDLLCHKIAEKKKTKPLIEHTEDVVDDFEWPITSAFDNGPSESETSFEIIQKIQTEPIKKEKRKTPKRGHRITPDEIPNIPQFVGMF